MQNNKAKFHPQIRQILDTKAMLIFANLAQNPAKF